MIKTWKLAVVFAVISCLFTACADDKDELIWEWEDDVIDITIPVADKSRVLWMDATANFKYLANSQENIKLYLDKAKETGFTEVVVDVRPPCGDVLYKSNLVDELKILRGEERTATWDYLGTFIEEGHKRGLKIYANMNVMVGGNTIDGGMVYRDAEKAAWTTTMYYPSGLISIMDDARSEDKFFNPVNPDVKAFVLSLIDEIVTSYPELDAIILDRARYTSIESDFSDLSRDAFETYIGEKVERFPYDIFTWNNGKVEPRKHYKKWLEFRAKVIHDLFEDCKNKVNELNPNIKFGTYTGSWYSTYYEVGVNWASKRYDPSKLYDWASDDYMKYGYADVLDIYMTGAYGTSLYGIDNEWSVEGAIVQAKKVTKGDVPVIASLYGFNFNQKPHEAEEATYIALTQGDGLMFFDMIYLILYDQWDDVKRGIDRAMATEK